MQWIKNRYDQFILLLVALLLLTCSVLLILRARSFSEIFAGIRGEPPKSTEVEQVDTTSLLKAEEMLTSPPKWKTDHPGSLFASKKYVLKDGTLIPPEEGEALHPPVENKWFLDHDLDILDPDILTQDGDGDGFTNFDEWLGKSDPNNKEEHPAYWTKLRLKQFIKRPFRLLFAAYDGNPADPAALTFQVNTLDLKQPSQFLKLGDKIEGTKFKIVDFEYKKVPNPAGGESDISELTLENAETKDRLVLVVEKTKDDPDSYALFKYLWNAKEFQVKKGKSLKLPPDNVEYIVIEITDGNAVIQDPSGEKHAIPKLE